MQNILKISVNFMCNFGQIIVPNLSRLELVQATGGPQIPITNCSVVDCKARNKLNKYSNRYYMLGCTIN